MKSKGSATIPVLIITGILSILGVGSAVIFYPREVYKEEIILVSEAYGKTNIANAYELVDTDIENKIVKRYVIIDTNNKCYIIQEPLEIKKGDKVKVTYKKGALNLMKDVKYEVIK